MFFSHDLKLGRPFKVLFFATQFSCIRLMGILFSNHFAYSTHHMTNPVLRSSLIMIFVMRILQPLLALFKLRSSKANSVFFKVFGILVYLTILVVSQSISIYLIVKKLPDFLPRKIKGISMFVIVFEFIFWDLIIQPLILIWVTKFSVKAQQNYSGLSREWQPLIKI